MLKALSIRKETAMVTLMGMFAVLAEIVAQTSSGTCIMLTFEQPRIPKSLIKE